MLRRTFLGSVAAQIPPRARRPNLLYIVIDQLSGLALPGMDANARMPHTRALAKTGVTFTHAYTAGMTCGPSRMSMDTGLFTQSHGVGSGNKPAANLESLTKTLASEGYVSSHPDGYNLEGERREHEKWLANLGYPQPLSSINGSEAMAKFLDLPLKWKCGRMGLAPEHAFDSYCAQRAMRFLEVNQSRPFACFLQLRGPHDPYTAPRPWDSMFDPAKIALPPYRTGEFADKTNRQWESFESQGASKMSDAQLRQILALYYGMAAFSDHCTGMVLSRLKELQLDSNTVVVLTADHGDTMGCHRFMGKDFAFYEPAVRVPMIFRAPGKAAGVKRTDPVSGIDLFPTLAELMGLPKPQAVHGESLVERWDGKEEKPERPIFAGQGVAGKNRAVMLRTPRYKYTRFDDGGAELYDLTADPNELTNRLSDIRYKATLEGLRRQLAEWETRYPAVSG